MEDEEIVLNAVVEHIVKELELGKSAQKVAQGLVEIGVPSNLAFDLVKKLDSEIRSAKRTGGAKTFAIGGGMAGLGLLITAGTYAAAQAGGYYVVTYGLVIVGVINMARGAWRMITA